MQWRIQELLVGGIIKGVDEWTKGPEGGAKRRSAEGLGPGRGAVQCLKWQCVAEGGGLKARSRRHRRRGLLLMLLCVGKLVIYN